MRLEPEPLTGMVALTVPRPPRRVREVPGALLSFGLTLGQAPRMLWEGKFSGYAHAAPVWVVWERTELPHLGRDLLPGTYTVDACAGGLEPTLLTDQVRAGYCVTLRDVPAAVRAASEGIEERAAEWHAANIGRVTYATRRLLRLLYRIPLSWCPMEEAVRPAWKLLATICSSYTSRSTWEVFGGYDDVPRYAARWTCPSDLGVTGELETVTHEVRVVE